MKGSTEKTLITGTIIALVTVLTIVLVLIWQSRRVRDTATWIRHTNQVLYGTKELLDISSRYELGVKNYLLTGDSIFLDSTGSLPARMHDRVRELRELTADNPVQISKLEELTGLVDQDQGLLGRAIMLSRGKDIAGAASLISVSARTGYSRRIREICDQLLLEEERLLAIRRAANQRRTTELNIVIYGLIVAVVMLGIVIFRKTRLDLARNERIRQELSEGNERLEERIAQQVADLRASEEKYKTLFYKSPSPKWIYDLDSLRFLEVNDAAIRNYGYTQEEFRAMTIADIRPPEDEDELMRDVETVRSVGVSAQQNWRHMRKDGTLLEVEVTAHSFDFEGRKARMVVASDITERRHSEQLLQALNEDLQRRAEELAASNAELERFAYIASHDLQEPLRMVSSFLQLLQKRYKDKLDEKADQYIHYAVDGAERMKALILDLLEYSRVGTGKENFTMVDMGEVMEEVGNIFRDKIAEAGASLEMAILPMVRGDKVQLTQLMQNLVGNALKYHSELPARIRVMVKERVGYWEFSVRDNGIGIDPQYFDKIFIIFQRLHNKSQYSGTGIGLAICKKIVERHGGRIWVEPAPDQGSIFLFTVNKQPS